MRRELGISDLALDAIGGKARAPPQAQYRARCHRAYVFRPNLSSFHGVNKKNQSFERSMFSPIKQHYIFASYKYPPLLLPEATYTVTDSSSLVEVMVDRIILVKTLLQIQNQPFQHSGLYLGPRYNLALL
ncbi:hypothetical protein M0804_001719 [Polistes exclamans]|nr:hypothetical protein M0804_001719 [Polistes exclamans]